MDIDRARRFQPFHSQPARLALIACAAAVIVIGWMVWQSRLRSEAVNRATVAEKALEQERAKLQGQPRTDSAVRRSSHDDPENISRVKQLYQEIEDLSDLQERVEQELTVIRRIGARKAREAAEAAVPRPAPGLKMVKP